MTSRLNCSMVDYYYYYEILLLLLILIRKKQLLDITVVERNLSTPFSPLPPFPLPPAGPAHGKPPADQTTSHEDEDCSAVRGGSGGVVRAGACAGWALAPEARPQDADPW